MTTREDVIEAVTRLDDITRLLRKECPWDAEQDERSIVPHLVEEAYELADAAHSGDDAKLVDELGDVLVGVMFLGVLLEERGAGSVGVVADNAREKLIRRHPHVFKDAAKPGSAEEMEQTWDDVKREERKGEKELFSGVAENLPGPNYARKIQRWAGANGFESSDVPFGEVRRQLADLEGESNPDAQFQMLGELLFAAVNIGRKLNIDSELALRAAADRFRARVEEDYRADSGKAERE